MKTKSERREDKKRNNRKMIVQNRSIFTIRDIIMLDKAESYLKKKRVS